MAKMLDWNSKTSVQDTTIMSDIIFKHYCKLKKMGNKNICNQYH